jgi:two-component system, NarL family, response regulator DegU
MSKKIHILIVDDSLSFRKGMRSLLSIQPDMVVVGEAESGQAAMKLLESHPVDLVLLDAQMPGINGVEATRRIKSLRPEVKVILMTMYPDYRLKAIEAGADTFLSKGLPPENVLAVLRGIVKV